MMAQNHDLFYPMLALFLWTTLILLLNVQVRVRAVLRGELTNRYFELFQGGEPSAAVLKTANHLRNLTEIPPLFYAGALLVMAMGRVDAVFVMLAWGYGALRVAHSLVHLTINKVPLRFSVFALSNLVLLVMWLRLAWLL